MPGALGQITPTCVSSTFPLKPLVRPVGDVNSAADLSVAAGLSRVVVTSNSGVRLMCKAGFVYQSAQAALNGSNVNTAAFAPTDINFTHYHTFDPRVIYDGYDGCFWMVAPESDLDLFDPWAGRIHIGVSGAGATDGEIPYSWSTAYWTKYTGDGPTGAAGPSLDPMDDNIFVPDHFDTENPLGHIPDRPVIAVDRDFLYILVREGTKGNYPSLDRMMMIVMCKADLVAGTPTVVTSQFIDLDEETGSSVHALAVDSTIPESGTHRVYMVTLPDLKALDMGIGHQFTAIRVGAFSGTGTFGECGDSLEWEYESIDVGLDSSDQFLGMSGDAVGVKGAAPGNPTGLSAFVPWSIFMNAMTRTLDDEDRRIWCIHHVRPVPNTDDIAPPPPTQLQWYQINLNGWPDTANDPTFDRVERIARTDPYGRPVYVFDGAIAANECEDVAVGYTQGAYYYNGAWIYPQFWKALYPAGAGPTIALVAAGASQYYNGGAGGTWADYAGAAPDPDPNRPSRFYGLHMTGYDDGGGTGSATAQWEAWLASWTFGSCDSFAMADLDHDSDVDIDDLAIFEEYAEQDNMKADLDENETIDTFDLVVMLNAIGESP